MPARRAERGLVLLEGRALALDVLSRPAAACECLFVQEDEGDPALQAAAVARGVRIQYLTRRALEKISTTKSPPPVALLAAAPTAVELDPAAPPPRLLVLDGIADPGNAGTLIRAAAAFRFAVALDGECVSPANEKLLRATAGVAFIGGLLHRIAPNSAGALCAVATVLALDAGAPRTLGSALSSRGTKPIAVLIGNESRGVNLSRWTGATPVRIPMAAAVESLNAAVSGAIAMYEVARSST